MLVAPVGRAAQASVWQGSWSAPNEQSPESLLEQALGAYDEGRYRQAGDLAAAAYAGLPLNSRTSPYGETVVFQATGAYREAWLIEGDPELLAAAQRLLHQHADDYDAKGKRTAPSTVTQELVRWERLVERCRQPEQDTTEGPSVAPSPAGLPTTEQERPRLRAGEAAVVGGAALTLGAGLLSAFVFGVGIAGDPSDGEFEATASPGHLAPAIPMALIGGVIGALGTHALVDRQRVHKRFALGIGLTTAGALGVITGAAVASAGAASWPAGRGADFDIVRAERSVDMRSAGLAVALASLGVLGPGIGALISHRARRPGKRGSGRRR